MMRPPSPAALPARAGPAAVAARAAAPTREGLCRAAVTTACCCLA
jgi:hypothetical protein